MALELILGWAFSQLALPGRNIERTHSMREYIQYICTLALPGRNSCACSVYHLCKKKQNWCSVYCLCKFMFSMFSMQTEYSACLVYRLCKVKWYSVCCLCKHYTHTVFLSLYTVQKKKITLHSVKWYSVCCLCKHYTHSFSITLHSAKKKNHFTQCKVIFSMLSMQTECLRLLSILSL